MKTVHVKADKGLFDEWKSLEFDINGLAGVVQNDFDLSIEEILAWSKSVEEFQQKVNSMFKKTHMYLLACPKT